MEVATRLHCRTTDGRHARGAAYPSKSFESLFSHIKRVVSELLVPLVSQEVLLLLFCPSVTVVGLKLPAAESITLSEALFKRSNAPIGNFIRSNAVSSRRLP
jgi:hypothetical protein